MIFRNYKKINKVRKEANFLMKVYIRDLKNKNQFNIIIIKK